MMSLSMCLICLCARLRQSLDGMLKEGQISTNVALVNEYILYKLLIGPHFVAIRSFYF